jgi:hypothetical protein
MTELLIGLTIVFVGYVLFEVVKTASHSDSVPSPSPPPPSPPATAKPAPAPAAEPRNTKAKTATAPSAALETPAPSRPSRATRTPAKPVPPAADSERGTLLRNPATGEVSPLPTNYRFAKKWIKEALVAENLLDRVYKQNELDDAASQRVKEALEKLRQMDKYQP